MPAADVQRTYFNDRSTPGTPTATTPRKPAQIYQELMDSYHRRLRKPQPDYGNDAAGLTNAHRFKARQIPSKGRGQPPPDNFEPIFKASKKFIPGRSFMASPELLYHHNDDGYIPTSNVEASPRAINPLAMSMDSGILSLTKHMSQSRPMSATGERPCLKMCDLSFRGSLQGSGLTCITEDPIKRPLRKPGTAAPTGDTKTRIFVLSEDLAGQPTTPRRPASPGPQPLDVESFNSPRDAMLNNTWARQAYEAGMTTTRPSTAPPASDRSTSTPRPMNEARRRYQEVQVANLDVFTYRHSGGICSKEYKLDDTRSPAPQLVSPSADAAREAYFAARQNYSRNRVLALTSMKKYC